jgi:hypothetical protein
MIWMMLEFEYLHMAMNHSLCGRAEKQGVINKRTNKNRENEKHQKQHN